MIRCWPLLAAGAVAGGIATIALVGGGAARILPYGWTDRPAAARRAPARGAAPVGGGLGEVCWWEAGGYYGPAFLPVPAGGFLPGTGGFGGGGYAAGGAGPGGAGDLDGNPAGPAPAGDRGTDRLPAAQPGAPPVVPKDVTAPGGTTPQDVPEPGSALLLAGGLAALWLRRRA